MQPQLQPSKQTATVAPSALTLLDELSSAEFQPCTVIDFRSQIALRQMVRDQQVDADVARHDRRKDWGLRIDAEILRAEIRFGTRTHREVAAEFARRGMRIETALRLLSPMRVAA